MLFFWEKKIRFYVICGMLLFVTACATKESIRPLPPEGEATLLECDDPQTQTAMNICSFEEADKAQAEVDKIYGALFAKISKPERVLLKKAKRAWMQYRKEQCEYESSFNEGGSIQPLMINLCYAGMANDYKMVLEHQLACVEQGALVCLSH